MRPTVALLAVLAACAAPQKRYDSSPPSVLASNGVAADEGLETDVAVRHRRVLADAAPVSLARSVGGLFGGGAGSPGPVVAQVAPSQPADPEKLVIEAWLDLRAGDVGKLAAEIRTRVEGDGGRVVSENVIGPTAAASSAALELRVPPGKAADFQVWLGTRAIVESRRVLASDVSKTLFDQELALKNLQLTMTRLQELAKKDMPMKELLELEAEMTRVRGEIEKLEGAQRFLLDRVAFATITLTISREGGPIEFAPHARIHPGAHVATLSLLDPAGRERTRTGGGVTVHIARYLTFDLDAFPARGTDTRAVVGTVGSALYSSFLGAGRRRWLNPYLGARGGYGYLSGEKCFIVGGELGLELFKHRYLLVDAAVRALAFFREDQTDVALHGQLGLEVPF